ncbi:MAG: hypothetical protein WC860_07035 [Candidatus Margulisiibacteriota bacterium]|jgi:hypothetical protein
MNTLTKNINLKIGNKKGGYTVQAFTDNGKYSLSLGNKKLPEETLIFNITPVSTCPLATVFCKKSCYALKAERLYPQVKISRLNNFNQSKNDYFVNDMIDIIKAIQDKKTVKYFRIHESGDFYNNLYWHKWVTIAQNFPDIVFYAYTKSFFIDASLKPKNFILLASIDTTSEERFLKLYEVQKQFFDKTFTIIPKNQKAVCGQDCSTCNLCFTFDNSVKNITVNLH